MGQSPSGSTAPRACAGASVATPNNLPPLTFHHVHGDNVRITPDGSTARRVESFCKGVAFSARPVAVNEKVCIRFSEISTSWSGVLRFGLTSVDPATLVHSLPKYACPDLTNKHGYWAKALAERFCQQDSVLHYFVTSSGDIHFGINGEEKGLFINGVETRNPLWVLVDIYGNSTEVKFVDPRSPLQLRREPSVDGSTLSTSFSAISLSESVPEVTFQGSPVQPLPLHRTCGRNVRILNERLGVVARKTGEFSQGYVFSARPMRPNETLIIQILECEPAYSGSLAIGLTSCDPATLTMCDLPDDAEQLLDRPEYWVIRPDAARGLRRGEELTVRLGAGGEVRVGRSGASGPIAILHVDPSATLWALADLYGSTRRVRLLTTTSPPLPPPPAPSTSNSVRMLAATGRTASLGSSVVAGPPLAAQAGTLLLVSLPPPQRLNSQYSIESLQPGIDISQQLADQAALCGSAVAVSHCGPAPSHYAPAPSHCSPASSHCMPVASHCSNNSLHNGLVASTSTGIYSVIGDPISAPVPGASGGNAGECAICCERAVDAVLYTCGHMCMCHACAVRQWRGAGHCPLCRARISDVIRTYRS